MSVVLAHSAGSQKANLMLIPVWDAKCKAFLRKNEGFRVSAVLAHSADSQKMDLMWTPVWDAKCKEFLMKMRDFGCQWCRRTARTRRKWI